MGEPEISTTMHTAEDEKATKELRDIADEQS
jgi:hypothetical protein